MKSTTETNTLTSATYEDLVREMLVRLGEDPDREGLIKTPNRVARSFGELMAGLHDHLLAESVLPDGAEVLS